MGSFLFEIEQLASKLRLEIEVKDRTYHLKRYERCFLGSDAVEWFRTELACSEREALLVGNRMISANLFRHVLDHHWFKNDELFYRFTSDEDHDHAAAAAAAAHLQEDVDETKEDRSNPNPNPNRNPKP